MLRGRQKLESFNNKQNVFKERARGAFTILFSFVNSRLSHRHYQRDSSNHPMGGRDWDWQPSFCRQTEAPPGLVMQCTTCLPTCATCVKPVPCDFSSAMPGVLGRRGFLVTVPVAFRRSTRPIYTWLYAAGPKWQKQDVRLDHSLHTVLCWQGDGCVEPGSRE